MKYFDALIVGAGFSGMYMLHKLRGLGLKVRVLEAGGDIGGTWYWNRYSGARCDVPSIEYSFSFSEELQQEWDWSEVMAAQPEILAYANHIAERFELRSDIQLNTSIVSAHYLEEDACWQLTTEDGEQMRASYCIMATGCLSVANTPKIQGANKFKGATYHTGHWPHEGVDFSGVKVGIIGTGSSGVQSIPLIAEEAEHLTVFQRTPNYTMPANNEPLSDAYRNEVKQKYGEIREAQRESLVGIIGYGYGFGGNSAEPPEDAILETTEEERKAAVEREGFSAILRYADVAIDPKANELACEMYRQQVARVVRNPETAAGLSPKGYPLGCKRPVIDSQYFEVFNQDHVTLVDLRKGGIECITETGVQTSQGHFELDALVYATGFDAITGALLKMDIRGRQQKSLNDHWQAGPRTYLGLQVHGFPNLFCITGPGSPSVLSNMFVSIEQHVDWITNCISFMGEQQMRTIEATAEAESQWIVHVNEVAEGTMFTAPSCHSWYLGVNIPGKPRLFMPYVGGVGVYREKCDAIAAQGYEGFELSG